MNLASPQARRNTLRKAIEKELADLDSGRPKWDLLVSLNTTTDISVLPTEILAKIFIYCKLSDDSSEEDRMQAFQVFNACSLWRKSAISLPELWTNIPVKQSFLMQEMLLRSKPLPIVVAPGSELATYRSMPAQRWRDNIVSALSTGRAGKVIITDKLKDLSRYLDAMRAPAIFLEELSIVRFGYFGESVSIPHGFLDGIPGRLSRLCLYGVDIRNSATSIYRALTHLEMSRCDYSQRPSTSHFLEILGNAVNLESLRLSDVLPWDGIPSSRTVNLPSLKDLELKGTLAECLHLRRYLTYPPGIKREFAAHSSSDDMNTIQNFVGPEVEALQSTSVVMLGVSQTHVVCIQRLSVDDLDPIFHIVLGWEDATPEQATLRILTLMDTIKSSPQLVHIHTLDIRENDGLRIANWTDIFRNAPDLHTLMFNGPRPIDILRALQSTTVPNDGGESIMLIPKLQRLEISQIEFNDVYEGGEETFFELLVDIITHRRNAGQSIRELNITNCREMSGKDVAGLQKIVDDVAWDQYVYFKGEEKQEMEMEEL